MTNESSTILKSHAALEDSSASRLDDAQPEIDPQQENGKMDTKNSSSENIENQSRLNASLDQQEASGENSVAKESLADWGVVVCVFLSNFIVAFDPSAFGVFYPHLVEHFGATTAAVGWCSSINGFFQAAVALFASYPIKSYGCRLPGSVGCLLFSIGMSLSCLAPNLNTIYFTYSVIAGSGSGLSMLATGIIIHQRFTRNRNLASGIGWIGFSLGGIIGPIVTNQIIQLYGWRGAFLVLGAIHAQRIPLALFYRTPKRLTSSSKQNFGTSSERMSVKVVLRYLKETFDFSIFRQPRYSVYAIAYIIHIFCLMGYVHHTVNRAVNVGLTRDQGVVAASLISITSTATRVIVSFISNLPKVNSSLLFATGMFFAFLSIVAIFIDPGIIGTMTSVSLFGIHLGCATTVFTIVAVDLIGVALLPRGLAILQFMAGFAKLATSPLIGWVFDVTRDYNKAFAIIGCLAFVSASLMVALTFVTKCYRKPVTKDLVYHPTDKALPNRATSEEAA